LFWRLIPLAVWRKKKETKKTKEDDGAWIDIKVKKERIRTQASVANPSVKKDSCTTSTMAIQSSLQNGGGFPIFRFLWLDN
jgi:hypothetical protein